MAAHRKPATLRPKGPLGDVMDKLVKLSIVVGVLLAAIGVFYHYVVFLPGVEREKEAQQARRQEAYSRCIEQADSTYSADWAATCKDQAESKAAELKRCLTDKLVLTNPYMGASYCKRTYGDSDSSPDCSLPHGRAESLDTARTHEQQRCATEARLVE